MPPVVGPRHAGNAAAATAHQRTQEIPLGGVAAPHERAVGRQLRLHLNEVHPAHALLILFLLSGLCPKDQKGFFAGFDLFCLSYRRDEAIGLRPLQRRGPYSNASRAAAIASSIFSGSASAMVVADSSVLQLMILKEDDDESPPTHHLKK
jgi:hypothetical protein